VHRKRREPKLENLKKTLFKSILYLKLKLLNKNHKIGSLREARKVIKNIKIKSQKQNLVLSKYCWRRPRSIQNNRNKLTPNNQT